jgi:hypothetical protein
MAQATTASPASVTVLISTDNPDNWVDLPRYVTIPTGQNYVEFEAETASDAVPSIDEMTASNGSGSVATDVLVE